MLRTLQLCLAGAFAMLLAIAPVRAQQDAPANEPEKPAATPPAATPEEKAEKPDAKPPEQSPEDPAKVDGHDRPTQYPRIRMGGNPDDTVRRPDGAVRKVETRAYLLDATDAMSASITVDSRESTRMEAMLAALGKSLDSLAARRDVRFNMVSFGNVKDLAAGADPLSVSPESIASARKWAAGLEAKGNGDLHALLKAVFEQKVDNATLFVGGAPARPAAVSDEELARHKDVNAFLLAEVRKWRADGGTTTLVITGIGLGLTEREFYKELAKEAKGSYLDS